jgi:antitoxin (DNA-binding transcriptional repressor) of toxin-antitoxin stability system
MIRVNMHEAKTRLSELVKAVEERGETVILQRHGRAVASRVAFGRGFGRGEFLRGRAARRRLQQTRPREALRAAMGAAAWDVSAARSAEVLGPEALSAVHAAVAPLEAQPLMAAV